MDLDSARLRSAFERLTGRGCGQDVFRALASAHAEDHRHYHGTRHLTDCLERLDETRALSIRTDEVEIALWFHDAIYDPRAADNEERSARWAREALREAGAPEDVRDRVDDLVLATKHDREPSSPDAMLVVDIDLSILGSEDETFRRYEEGIRREYAWVPEDVYRRERARILRSFLDRRAIFHRETFRRRFEVAARYNLTEALGRLTRER